MQRGIDVLRRIREVDQISSAQLPIAVYTDKNFNFLPNHQFNILYKLDARTLHKDRDDDPLMQISPSSEYLRLLNTIESNRGGVSLSSDKVFISHGSSNIWQDLQSFLEGSMRRHTVELALSGTQGRTVITDLVRVLSGSPIIVRTPLL